jgi:excisionase family DNA binding protein
LRSKEDKKYNPARSEGAMSPTNSQRLDSWKEIAAYLGRDLRTVRRWEKEKGLPVHRVPGGDRRAVFAYRAEIDGWLTVSDVSSLPEDGDSVTVPFEFPAPVKTACEQYLLYFAQFLKDLGVEVEAKIEERASVVLFSVTPTDKSQALDNIREALEIYLRMPSAPNFDAAASQFGDVAVSQLKANVLHLQSQLMLANATLEMRNAVIEARGVEIASLKEAIDLMGLKPQDAPDSRGNADKEPLVGDLVSVKKYNYKFLEIDFPRLLRRLRRRS